MKAKIAFLGLAAIVIAAGSLTASEAVWDVVVTAGLQPSAWFSRIPCPNPPR